MRNSALRHFVGYALVFCAVSLLGRHNRDFAGDRWTRNITAAQLIESSQSFKSSSSASSNFENGHVLSPDATTSAKSVSYGLFLEDAPYHSRLLAQMAFRPPLSTKEIKIILPQGQLDKVPLGPEVFRQEECPVNNCRLQAGMSDEADAVIWNKFTTPSLVEEAVKLRHRDQTWIYYSMESPLYATPLSNVTFNWTATYRRDSTIPSPYGFFVKKSKRLPPVDYLKGKRKMAAWFVSHCHTMSGRENYVKELGKYIHVDVYGKCGNLSCPRGSKRCSAMLRRDYKFYLAFENSPCMDYVTEKLFLNAFRNGVVPIVLGGRLSDYEDLAPPNSFLHVHQFQSPQHLAQHLNYLSENPQEYNKLMEWRRDYEIVESKFWCRLCSMLNIDVNERRRSAENLKGWWGGKEVCQVE